MLTMSQLFYNIDIILSNLSFSKPFASLETRISMRVYVRLLSKYSFIFYSVSYDWNKVN